MSFAVNNFETNCVKLLLFRGFSVFIRLFYFLLVLLARANATRDKKRVSARAFVYLTVFRISILVIYASVADGSSQMFILEMTAARNDRRWMALTTRI